MRADLHVHTRYSGPSTLPGLGRVLRESYNTPEQVYRLAKARGMDLVAITDHDAIGGALALGDRGDVIVGCEVTAEFPDEPFCVHLNVLDITETQHDEVQRRRRNVRDLMPYLRAQGIFTSLNHVASGINGPITGSHVAFRRATPAWAAGLIARAGGDQRAQGRQRRAAGPRYTCWTRSVSPRRRIVNDFCSVVYGLYRMAPDASGLPLGVKAARRPTVRSRPFPFGPKTRSFPACFLT